MREEGSEISASRPDAEARLRDALSARAEQVQNEPPGYRQVSAAWTRRERKRRMILAILVAAIFAAADAVGLWALNQANPESHVIFSTPTAPAPSHQLTRIGQP